MAVRSGRVLLAVRAVALTVAYALVLQVLLTSVFAARVVGLSPAAAAQYCLNAAVSSGPADDGEGGGRTVAHCPLCTLRADIAPPPPPLSFALCERPAFALDWPPEAHPARAVLVARAAHRPRGPPAVSSTS